MAPDRPPTILGEYGEGYCRYCHFIEALNQYGLIVTHNRGIGNTAREGCEGSGTRPPSLTPVTSRKAAFSTRPGLRFCGWCGETVAVTSYTSGPVYSRHWIGQEGGELCNGTARPVPPSIRGRDHSGERGPSGPVDLRRH